MRIIVDVERVRLFLEQKPRLIKCRKCGEEFMTTLLKAKKEESYCPRCGHLGKITT